MLVPKLRLIRQERKQNSFSPEVLNQANTEQKPVMVFHCASHGEFDMIVPLLTADLRNRYFIVAAFFSPSGFKHAKADNLVDFKVYVPWDSNRDMRLYLDFLQPHTYVFVKYDFWLNLMTILNQRNVRTVVVNGLVRQSSFYFKSAFRAWKKSMTSFEHWFVQDEDSSRVLKEIGITQVDVTGDLRFERVFKGKITARSNHILECFTKDKTTIIFGSSWPEEELHISAVFDALPNVCVVVAPHDVSETHVREIITQNEKHKPARYTEVVDSTVSNLLILDTIGLLREAYQYADLAIVGGGYGRGLHNVLEPAVWNIPVLCGPEIDKNPEAKELQSIGGLEVIRNQSDVQQAIHDKLEPANYKKIQSTLQQWFAEKQPSTKEILDYLLNSRQ